MLYFEEMTKAKFLLIIKQVGNNRAESYRGFKVLKIRLDIITDSFARFEFDTVDELLSTLSKVYLSYYGDEDEKEQNKKKLSDNNTLHYLYNYQQFDGFLRALENDKAVRGMNFEFLLDRTSEHQTEIRRMVVRDLSDPNLRVSKLIRGEDFLVEADSDTKNFRENINNHYQALLEDETEADINRETLEQLEDETEHYIERLQGYGKGSPKLQQNLAKAKYVIRKSRSVHKY